MTTCEHDWAALDLEKILAMAEGPEIAPGDDEIQRRFLATAAPRLVSLVRELARAIVESDARKRMTEPCGFCWREPYKDDHDPACPVLRARAIIGDAP